MTNFDFSSCMIDFTICPSNRKMIEQFPELSAFQEFKEVPDHYIKIAIATSDIDSPLLRIKERESMMTTLFEFLRIPIESEEDKKFYNDVLHYDHDDIAKCRARYLQLLHNTDWTQWITLNEILTYLTFQSVLPKGKEESENEFMTRKLKCRDNIKKTGNDIKQLEAIIFPDSRSAREAAKNEAKKIVTYAEKYSEANTYI